jgi:hypothetical protein
MALKFKTTISLIVVGDGSTTDVSFDLNSFATSSGSPVVLPPVGIYPSDIESITSSGSSVTGTLDRNIVNLSFSTAPGNGVEVSLTIRLLYQGV